MTTTKAIIDRFWNLFESDQFSELEALIDRDCHFKMPGMELRGPAAIVPALRAYRAAFPDMRHETQDFVGNGDTIALEIRVEGTHTGPMQTPRGTVPATGNRVVWESCDYIQTKDGKLVSWHVYHDPMPFLAALGQLPG